MILSNLKKVCAAYHQIATSALTVDSLDLFLVALNNAKDNAQLLHNFELARVQATLDIDGETGGRLSDAVILGSDVATVVITGTLSPNGVGTYSQVGVVDGYPVYRRTDEAFYIRWSLTNNAWIITVESEPYDDAANTWRGVIGQTSLNGNTFAGTGTNTGVPTVVLTESSGFSSLREVIAVQRRGVDGTLTPLDFTRSDIPIERDRYALELEDGYDAFMRYPSDANLLQRGSNGSVVQRGGSLFVYPLDTVTQTPLSVTLEAYGNLADYTSSSLTHTEPTDFLVRYGATYLQWSVICELNYLFQTFVPRQEGVLSPPETKKEEAWRDLLLWDTYMIDSHSTRSR